MTSCGIDFGTSNSALALLRAGKVDLAHIEGDSVTIPSAIFFPVRGKPCFGRQAIAAFMNGEDGRFMRSLKRILGTSLMGQATLVNSQRRKFEDILGFFLRHIKDKAEAQRGAILENVVMGRPVHFSDLDPAADARAEDELARIAKSVGFKHVAFEYEPVAAGFAHERGLEEENLALVVDIGGGTSDFTVIRLSKAAMDKPDRADDILAHAGIRTGGNDFDKDLSLAGFMPYFGYKSTHGAQHLTLPVGPFHEMSEWAKVNFQYTPQNRAKMAELLAGADDRASFNRFVTLLEEERGHQLLSVVEDCKIDLTVNSDTTADLAMIEAGFAIDLSRNLFEGAVMRHVRNIDAAASECLIRAGLQPQEIDLVILTGGTAETPVLNTAIRQKFPTAKISEDNKLASVGIGLGYNSLRKFG